MLKHSSYLQKSSPAWIAVPEVFALHFCFTCTYYSNILWQLKPPEKYFPVYKNETTWILHNFAADWTGPVHLQRDKVFGYWIQYLLLQATPSYHPFHKTGEMGQVSQIQLEAQPIPSLQNLPNPWQICTCQGHMLMGMLKPFGQKNFAPWTTAASCESAWTNSLDTAAASQLEMCMHTHTLVLSTAHTSCLWCPAFPPPPSTVQSSSPLTPSPWFMVLLDFVSSRGWISFYKEK